MTVVIDSDYVINCLR